MYSNAHLDFPRIGMANHDRDMSLGVDLANLMSYNRNCDRGALEHSSTAHEDKTPGPGELALHKPS